MEKKLVRYDMAKINYSKRKLCECFTPHYEIDYQNKLVMCVDCGAMVEPLDALVAIARQWDRINDTHAAMVAEREAIAGYSPRLKVIKELEKQYKGPNAKMVPTCPHCHKGFELHELINGAWKNRDYCPELDEIE